MSKTDPVLARTNTTPDSCTVAKCDCDTMWSLTQQFSTVRLCVKTGKHKGKLITDYAVRARRIAATYARFYLETEEGGTPEFKGRYYWMAIGAFASKTVACTIEAWQVQLLGKMDETAVEGLGKGNFWLFCDISGWHWYRNMYPGSFDQCAKTRNSENYVREVKTQLKQLPWQAEALPKIRNLGASKFILKGFEKVSQFERATNPALRLELQLANLMDLANHEQSAILQPLIYDDKNFSARIELQRSKWVNWASPLVELVFSHECSIKDRNLKSVAPSDVILESFESRMSWIGAAAEKFHQLMQFKRPYMEKELQTMASWVDMVDDPSIRRRAIESSEEIIDKVRGK